MLQVWGLQVNAAAFLICFAPQSLSMLVATKFLTPFWANNLPFVHSKVVCPKALWAIFISKRILFSLSLYLNYGRLTFPCLLSNWLYMKSSGILSLLIQMTWPTQCNCDCIRKLLIPLILLFKKLASEVCLLVNNHRLSSDSLCGKCLVD